MKVEALPFTTLQTNEITFLILTTQKNYFQIVNKYWPQHGRTLAESPISVVFQQTFSYKLYIL
jgi:hypothetical protein